MDEVTIDPLIFTFLQFDYIKVLQSIYLAKSIVPIRFGFFFFLKIFYAFVKKEKYVYVRKNGDSTAKISSHISTLRHHERVDLNVPKNGGCLFEPIFINL